MQGRNEFKDGITDISASLVKPRSNSANDFGGDGGALIFFFTIHAYSFFLSIHNMVSNSLRQ